MSESQKIAKVEKSALKVADRVEETLEAAEALLSKEHVDVAEEHFKDVTAKTIDGLKEKVEDKIDEKVDDIKEELKELMNEKVEDLTEVIEEKAEKHRPIWEGLLHLFVCLTRSSKKDDNANIPLQCKCKNSGGCKTEEQKKDCKCDVLNCPTC